MFVEDNTKDKRYESNIKMCAKVTIKFKYKNY